MLNSKVSETTRISFSPGFFWEAGRFLNASTILWSLIWGCWNWEAIKCREPRQMELRRAHRKMTCQGHITMSDYFVGSVQNLDFRKLELKYHGEMQHSWENTLSIAGTSMCRISIAGTSMHCEWLQQWAPTIPLRRHIVAPALLSEFSGPLWIHYCM